MSDEKKEVIERILSQIRIYNPQIGSYLKSMPVATQDYFVMLSNGYLSLPKELITDYENSPENISEEKYRNAAKEFQAT